MRWAETVDHSLNFIKENLRRACTENITIIKSRENSRGNESFGGFKRKILLVSDWTDPPDLQVSNLFLQSKNDTKVTSCIWKMGSHCDPHIIKKEEQFQEQSLSEESVLSSVYSELPRPLYLKCKNMAEKKRKKKGNRKFRADRSFEFFTVIAGLCLSMSFCVWSILAESCKGMMY